MKYYLDNNIIIKSEDAAKSYKQSSQHVINYIKSLDYVEAILDYGCGRLRYSKLLSNRCNKITLVDSIDQINRLQTIYDEKTTVKDYVKSHMKDAVLLSIEEYEQCDDKFDIIFCSNVLSAIPSKKVRKHILHNLKKSLSSNGKLIIINQYRNSFYNNLKTRENTIEYMEGVLTIDADNSKYYGLLNKEIILSILKDASFNIVDCWYKDQSCFVVCN